MQNTIGFYFLFVLMAGIFSVSQLEMPQVSTPFFEWGSIDNEYQSGTLLLVGDIMLGRYIEELSSLYGMDYPFLGTKALAESVDLAIGNFEGAVPEVHIKTADRSLTFSVQDEFLSALPQNGFDVLSLANNHSYDFGDEGYVHTLSRCQEHDVLCQGHPNKISSSSVLYTDVGDAKVGVLFLHTLFEKISTSTLISIIEEMSKNSDLQYVFVHWGNEYETTSDDKQQALAHFLIDTGIDGVIGHHPHVVQNIEIYKDKLIAYSLGNFIFDQYFSEEVQNAITLMVTIEKDRVVYNVIPISSEVSNGQPRIMNYDMANEYRTALFKRSSVNKNSAMDGSFLVVYR